MYSKILSTLKRYVIVRYEFLNGGNVSCLLGHNLALYTDVVFCMNRPSASIQGSSHKPKSQQVSVFFDDWTLALCIVKRYDFGHTKYRWDFLA